MGLAAADVNGDGRPDIISGNSVNTGSSGSVSVLLNTTAAGATTPTFASAVQFSLNAANGGAAYGLAMADVNGDSKPDALTANSGDNSAGVLLNSPNLVVTTATASAAGTYNSITVQSGGSATLAGAVTVNSDVTINDGGTLLTNCQALTGAGTFTLAAGGTLGICSPQGLSSTAGQGAVQTTGPRSLSPDATCVYNGTAAQVTGNTLPSQVRGLATTNAQAITLSQA